MTRLEKLLPNELTAEQRSVYESIVGGPRSNGKRAFPLVDGQGGLEGPFNAMLLHAPLGAALQSLGSAIRFTGVIPDRAREMAILTVAVQEKSDFEWFAHAAVARQLGLTSNDLDRLRSGETPLQADDTERCVVAATEALLDGDLDDSAFAAVESRLGASAVFNLTTLVGYYRMLALQLRVFRVALPEQSAPNGQEP